MNERQRFVATCITVVCIAAIAGGVYLVIDDRERTEKAYERLEVRETQDNEAMQSAVKQFDGHKADLRISEYFTSRFNGVQMRLPDGWPTYSYSKSEGTFDGDFVFDVNYVDTGWQRWTCSARFYPGGALANINVAKSGPAPRSPTATTQ